MSSTPDLPKCLLTDLFVQKTQARVGLDVNLVARFEELRKRVADETRYIVVVFPEYTLHDDDYHMSHLFRIAETIVGAEQLERLNATELFILAASLCAHDWGMAVSDAERALITSDTLPDNIDPSHFRLLTNERETYRKFRHEQLVNFKGAKTPEVELTVWREHVRKTHAFRSAERVKEFLGPVDGGLAEAVARVCASHWLNVEDLDDYRSYPPNYSVLQNVVNLRALAVYLRLTDLFDIGEDRTPYVIWKYVAPRDPKSKLEWAKHRAVHPVSAERGVNGRVIQIDGTTDDVEVYAALEDLRGLCDKEVRACKNLITRMKEPRYQLDIVDVDWRINASGFKPVMIRFTFAPDRMFQILGDEIYSGDVYVFLRELLQNSVDAIRLRRELLSRKEEVDLQGRIRVDIEYRDNENMVVHWTDNGSGMDEYIVRNYLATAGQSYYQSDDFKRVGLPIDPISRFGIGVLSCFAVAERIHIKTRRDPHFEGAHESLSIDVPSFSRYFRIETLEDHQIQVGTTVSVYVDRRKLPENSELKIVEYLQTVAGFVEFPIIINEHGRCTVITAPGNEYAQIKKEGEVVCENTQLSLKYPLESIVLSDSAIAGRILAEESFDLASDLGLEDFEGRLVFLTLGEGIGDLRKGPHDTDAEIFIPLDTKGEPIPTFDTLKIYKNTEAYFGRSFLEGMKEFLTMMDETETEDFSEFMERAFRSLSDSSWVSLFYRVYRDGVLLSSAHPPFSFQIRINNREVLPAPLIIVNIPKSAAPKVDLARTRILDSGESWDAPIFKAFREYLKKNRVPALLALPPLERLRRMVRWITDYRISEEELWGIVPEERWPVLCITKENKIDALEWESVKGRPIALWEAPGSSLDEELLCAFFDEAYKLPQTYEELLKDNNISISYARRELYPNRFPQALDTPLPTIIDAHPDKNLSISASYAFAFSGELLRKSYILSGLVTGTPDIGDPGDFIVVQKVLSRRDENRKPPQMEELIDKAVNSPSDLSPDELDDLRNGYNEFPTAISFPEPIQKKVFWNGIWNLSHPLTMILIKLTGQIILKDPDKSEKFSELRSKIFYLGRDTMSLRGTDTEDLVIFTDNLARMIGLARELEFSVDNLAEPLRQKDFFSRKEMGTDYL